MVQMSAGSNMQGQAQEGQQLQRKLNHLHNQCQDGGNKEQQAKLKKACQGFESLFLQKIWEKMQDTVPKQDFLHNKQEKMYLSMFNKELAKQWSDQGGIGLGDMLYQQLTGQLEKTGRSSGSTSSENLNTIASPAPATFQTGQSESDKTNNSLLDEAEKEKSPNLNALTEYEIKNKVDTLAREIEENWQKQADEPGPGFLEQTGSSPSLAEDKVPVPIPKLDWPLEGQISSEFGWRDDPFTGEKAWHSGIDIAASKGSPVKSCWPGKVVYSGEKQGYGKLVILEHPGGWQSYYGHNSKNIVQEGQTVRPGQHIADVGDTGRSTGPHLHFELRQGNLAWNPRQIEQRLLAGLEIGQSA